MNFGPHSININLSATQHFHKYDHEDFSASKATRLLIILLKQAAKNYATGEACVLCF